MEIPTDLNPACVPLAWLLGTWEGFGLADYPTITSCRFHQRMQFTNDGQGFLSYFSRSWQIDDDGNEVEETEKYLPAQWVLLDDDWQTIEL